MKFDILFLGRLFPREKEAEIKLKMKTGMQDAANALQWNIIDGLEENNCGRIKILNYLPVNSYPKGYTDREIEAFSFAHTDAYECDDLNVGCTNRAIIKHIVNIYPFKRELFLILLCVFLVIYISSGDGIIRWAMFMSEKFSEIGFSTRVFDFIVEDELANTSGRDAIAEKIFVAITQDPFGGYGFMGDRSIVGTYCHNIVLEILCSYGIVFGGIGIITILSMVVLSIKRSWGNPVSWLMVMSACLVFVKLMFSSSYVFEPYFYMLLGLSIGSTRRCKSSV